MMMTTECVIIGGGVIGLTIARSLSAKGVECVVLEKNKGFGMETSSRNSEVIHRGIYYKSSSFKAKLCLQGRSLLLEYIKNHNISSQRCGKLIISADKNEHEQLILIYEKAILNGVNDLSFLSGVDVQRLEPTLKCYSALYSPNTYIFDSHAYMLNMIGDIENNNSHIIYDCSFEKSILNENKDFQIQTNQGDITSRYLINAGGLHSTFNCRNIFPYPTSLIPKMYFAKGNYFKLTMRSPFSKLIYPLPNEYGLGVHCTLDLNSECRFGPDVEWIQPSQPAYDNDSYAHSSIVTNNAYAVDHERISAFITEIKKYYPTLDKEYLIPDYSGIRPKLKGPVSKDGSYLMVPERTYDDFIIEGADVHGVKGLVNLFGIESPGLTASLAIGNHVRDLLLK